MVNLKDALEANGMQLEMDKCHTMGSTAEHRRALVEVFKEHGVNLVGTARDLGTDAAPGGRRRAPVRKTRLEDGQLKLNWLAPPPKKKGRRAVQTKIMGVSAATYGVEVQGMSPACASPSGGPGWRSHGGARPRGSALSRFWP